MNSDTQKPSENLTKSPWFWLSLAAVLWVCTFVWALTYFGHSQTSTSADDARLEPTQGVVAGNSDSDVLAAERLASDQALEQPGNEVKDSVSVEVGRTIEQDVVPAGQGASSAAQDAARLATQVDAQEQNVAEEQGPKIATEDAALVTAQDAENARLAAEALAREAKAAALAEAQDREAEAAAIAEAQAREAEAAALAEAQAREAEAAAIAEAQAREAEAAALAEAQAREAEAAALAEAQAREAEAAALAEAQAREAEAAALAEAQAREAEAAALAEAQAREAEAAALAEAQAQEAEAAALAEAQAREAEAAALADAPKAREAEAAAKAQEEAARTQAVIDAELDALREQQEIDALARESEAEELAETAGVTQKRREFELLRAQELGTLSVLSSTAQFVTQSSEISDELERTLDRMFDPLFLYSGVDAVVSVASNEMGSAASDNALSENRAQAIVLYMVDKGLEAERFSVQVRPGGGLPVGTHRVRVFIQEEDE